MTDDHRPITGRLRTQASRVAGLATLTNVEMAELLILGLPAQCAVSSLSRADYRLEQLQQAVMELRAVLRGCEDRAREMDEEDRAAWLAAYNEAEEAGNVTVLDPSRREAA